MKFGVFVVVRTQSFDVTDDTISGDEIAIVELGNGKSSAEVVVDALAQLDIDDLLEYKGHEGTPLVRVMKEMVEGDRLCSFRIVDFCEDDSLSIFYTVKENK